MLTGQSNGLYNVNCDGLTGHGSWITSDGKEEQITSAANYSGGGGGKGQRHWFADAPVDNSGGTRIEFASLQPELWIRWYTRFQIGFQWNVLIEYKAFIVDPGLSTQIIIGPRWQDQLGIVRSGNPYDSPSGNGWNTIMVNGGTDARGNKTSDGQWHLFEIHLKMDTNGNNGIVEFIVDGVRRLYRTDVNYGTSAGWSYMVIGDNDGRVANGVSPAYYIDYDDMVISISGPIGGSTPVPTSTLDIISPSIPSNLSATTVSSSQINLSWTASTDNVGVTGYRIYRCSGAGCTPTAQIATSATNSYSNTGLTASTTYTYRVSAYDAAGNVSGQSNSASAATQAVADTTPPAAPTGLTVR